MSDDTGKFIGTMCIMLSIFFAYAMATKDRNAQVVRCIESNLDYEQCGKVNNWMFKYEKIRED